MSNPNGTFVLQYESGDMKTRVENRDGVGWFDAPIPGRFHRCFTQTKGWTGYFSEVHRCPCGAISRDGRRWIERNSRKASA